MVTGIDGLTIDTFPDVKYFSLLSLGRYLFNEVNGNRHPEIVMET